MDKNYAKVLPLHNLPQPENDKPIGDDQAGRDSSGGLNIIKAILDLFDSKEPICLRVLQKYCTRVDLKIEAKRLYYVFVTMALAVDMVFSMLVMASVLIILVGLVGAFLKGIGIIDWLPQLILKGVAG